MGLLEKSIDKNTPIPLYYQIRQLILNEIQNGTYPPGSMLPTENDICDAFGLSRTTVRQAINDLAKEGWLYRVKSKGTFVSRPKINQDFINKVESFDDQITRLGMIPSTELISVSVETPTKDVAEVLNITGKTPVIRILRKRYADKDPIVLVESFLPYDKCRFVMDHDLNSERLYTILSASPKTEVRYVERRIEAISATEEIAKLLEMKKGSPILYAVSTGYSCFNEPIEHSIAHYCGNKTALNVTVKATD